MEIKFVIQDLISAKYWYGYYSNKNWTDDIKEARIFDTKEECDEWIKYNSEDIIKHSILSIIEIYLTLNN